LHVTIEDDAGGSFVTLENLKQKECDFRSARAIEWKSRFGRVTPEVFIKVLFLCNSPAIAKFSQVCKIWQVPILATPDLFRNFEMEGNFESLIAGLEAFSKKCGHSLRTITIGINRTLDEDEKARLEAAILPSKTTLKLLSIASQGDICQLIMRVASKCDSLKLLCSTRFKRVPGNIYYPTTRC